MQHNLRRLGDLRDFEVASDDPDVRGWDVQTRDGRSVGEVEELIVDPAAQKVRYLEVDLDRDGMGLSDSRCVSIPVESAEVDRGRHAVLVNGLSRDAIAALPASEYSTGRTQRAGRSASSDRDTRGERRETTIARSEEELRVGKRQAQTGEVVVGKHVETEHVSKPVTVERERVRIDRRPVEGDVRNRETRIEADEVHVPLTGEELIVEKRPVVKEELVISKDTVRETENVDAEVRKEEFDIRDEGGRVLRDSDRAPFRRGGE